MQFIVNVLFLLQKVKKVNYKDQIKDIIFKITETKFYHEKKLY